eukprot:CAMPEP_0170539102 /NCGR_PEP_ID=MMETSP0209-20121228/103713_1 /TAXON_ID=665100 ORGANISM="Litonotus pictus, Strain P1" /NCGR_SAMPLE_ID=MMETSP0209 /ASSEMBLY_ACC=CAM_ASM_000301 /LENGTH=217 /DNA_ID=CAMNT_0010840941 /DNA_START=561 /DNA_END=1211 /DNA_ORIENTATION=+
MYMFDYSTLSWSKLETTGNLVPSARDSHTALIFNDEMFVFGGNWQDKKLNDLWKLNLIERKWAKINAPNGPSSIEGHVTSLVLGKMMMIQGGLDESNRVCPELYLFDLVENKWYSCQVKDFEKFAKRECRSCVSNGEFCYLFGGEVENEIFNDLFKVSISYVNETYFSKWTLEEPITKKPPERSSHSSVFYEPDLLIITGGEGQDSNGQSVALSDTW